MVGGADDPRSLSPVDRMRRSIEVGAGLDLDGNQQSCPACNDVDFADATAVSACQNPKPLEAQQQRGMLFGTMSAPFGGLAAGCPVHGAALIGSARRR